MRGFMKRIRRVLLLVLTFVGMISFAEGTVSANSSHKVKFYQQTKPVLQTKLNSEIKTVANQKDDFLYHFSQNYGVSNGYYSNPLQRNGEQLNSYNPNVQFNTSAYLPTSFDRLGYVSPQAIAVSPDGNTLYEMGHFLGSNSNNGRIIKYNIGDLQNRFHTNQNGSMQLIREASKWRANGYPASYSYNKAKRNYKRDKKHYNFYKKVHFHSKRWCRRHHVKFHKKNWVKSHNRFVKSGAAKHGRKRAKIARNKAKKKFNKAKSGWNGTKNFYNQILADIQVGPEFETGHGQALSIKPTDVSIWYMNYADGNQFVSQIDPNSLTPTTHLSIDSTPDLGHSFAFDNQGNAWFWVYPNATYKYGDTNDGSNKAAAIYKGTISNNKMTFKEQYKLQNGPGTYQQTCGFNPVTNRFYLVSDSSFISVPTNKIPDPSEVYSFKLTNDRESEGLAFNRYGMAYFLSNKGPEVFTSNNLTK